MFMGLMILCQLPGLVSGLPSCTRKLRAKSHATDSEEEVFTNGQEASMFLARRLLYNRLDFEMFTPGNLERECYEEVCNLKNYERYLETTIKTMAFWKHYTARGPYFNSDDRSQKIDAIGLLTGLVAAGVFLVIFGLLGYYFFTNRCRSRRDRGSSHIWRNSGSIISRRQDDVSLAPVSLPLTAEDSGPPSYEEAVSSAGVCDVPPPPYPGITQQLKVLKKSLSLPNPSSL
ncbi:transmembrane gamma-carboxyglutamic acid protein 4 [Rhinatrema bivittatum]|uniref:transmembrane gamma-carboxyglutamic acid protein 4 n=1 Tax=Rhinatrema bivittatum TaxID=194408 RepID=UPI0011293783|nr:transmembrane gamma-carboxyglutamic acid protein 4 [Rhinatrema bivittatum]XP_029438825.1 transmembrane gamma-carboxyglutamic acid protein 4 [Rhinatrema bivittatum]